MLLTRLRRQTGVPLDSAITARTDPTEPRRSPATLLQQITSWQWALLLIAAMLVVRLVYLIWLCPYQLLGDESYYWEQARHLDLGYNEKGPLLAWMIAPCCKIFGDHDWVIRLPMALASAAAAWGVGGLTLAVTRGNQRAALFSVVCFLLLPALDANAQICTQDGVLIALWVALTAIGLRLFRRMGHGDSTGKEWLALWVTLGIGMLLKQSVLVFLPSLAIFAWLERRNLRRRIELFYQPVLGAIIVLLISSPMIIWNARHGWPTLAHTLGHLGAGGDQAGQINRGNPILWMLGTIGGIVGAFGPPAIVLFLWASHRAVKNTKDDPQRRRDRLWLLCAAWPSVAFFLILSLHKPVVPSWPLPSMVPLVVLLADLFVTRTTPSRRLHLVWKSQFVYGVVGAFLIMFPTVITHVPIIGDRFAKHVMSRFTGHREAAEELDRTLTSITAASGQPPLIVTRHYMQAGLYSFYLPGHPTVFTAGKYLGKRSTTFDQWPDTSLENPALFGRTLLLDGEGDVPWEKALRFDAREPLDGGKFFLATNYRGPRPDHPSDTGDDE